MKSVCLTLLPTYVQRTTALHVHVGVTYNERIMTHLPDALGTYAAYLKRVKNILGVCVHVTFYGRHPYM